MPNRYQVEFVDDVRRAVREAKEYAQREQAPLRTKRLEYADTLLINESEFRELVDTGLLFYADTSRDALMIEGVVVFCAGMSGFPELSPGHVAIWSLTYGLGGRNPEFLLSGDTPEEGGAVRAALAELRRDGVVYQFDPECGF